MMVPQLRALTNPAQDQGCFPEATWCLSTIHNAHSGDSMPSSDVPRHKPCLLYKCTHRGKMVLINLKAIRGKLEDTHSHSCALYA